MQLVWRTAVRSVGTLGVAACVLAAVAPARAQPATSDRQGLVQDYCVRCHNDRRLTGGLSLEGVQADDPTAHAEIWEKVLRKLQARSMPPVGSPRPDEVVYTQVIRALELAIDRAADATPRPGRTASFHRLSRTEYQHAVRDLLDLEGAVGG